MVSQTKLDDSFSEGQFLIEGFHSPFRFRHNKNGRGIMLYVREDTRLNYKAMIFLLRKGFSQKFIKRNS